MAERPKGKFAETFANINTGIGVVELAAAAAFPIAAPLAVLGVFNIAQGEGVRYVSRRRLERKANPNAEKKGVFPRFGTIFKRNHFAPTG